jgi:hypothetical protein
MCTRSTSSSEDALNVDTVTVRNAVRKLRVSYVGLLWTRRSVCRLFSTSCLSSVLPYFPPTQSSSCRRFELVDKGQRRFREIEQKGAASRFVIPTIHGTELPLPLHKI